MGITAVRVSARMVTTAALSLKWFLVHAEFELISGSLDDLEATV